MKLNFHDAGFVRLALILYGYSLVVTRPKSPNAPKIDDKQKEAWGLLYKTIQLDYKIVDILVDKIIVYNDNKIEVKLKYADSFNPPGRKS